MLSDAAHAPRRSGRRWSRRRLIIRAGVFCLLGLIASGLTAWALAARADLMEQWSETSSLVAADRHNDISLRLESALGAERIQRIRTPILDRRNWGVEQVLGPPDTHEAGDIRTAWASATPDGSPEWLIVTFAAPVEIREVLVHETYYPGALTAIAIVADDGSEERVWEGVDPTPRDVGAGVSRITLSPPRRARRIKLFLDSPAVKGWNEIDAVGVVDGEGVTHWAVEARASSSYANRDSGTNVDHWTTPGWCPGEVVGALPEPEDTWVVDHAAGWPFLAFRGSFRATQTPRVTATDPHWSIITRQQRAPLQLPVALPLRPVWPGAFLNAAIYGVVLALIAALFRMPWRVAREFSRLRRGACLACGYPLQYVFSGGCPECGWGRPARAPDSGEKPVS